MKTAIITDSSCNLPLEYMQENEIFFAPLSITYSDRDYADVIEITADEIIENLTVEVPKTSLPKPEYLKRAMEAAIAAGYQRLIGIFISSGMSGTYNMARHLFDREERVETKLLDSKTISLELGFIVAEMAREVKAGLKWENVEEKFEQIREKTLGVFTLDTLKYLRMGGRIGRAEHTIGEVLGIKPLIAATRDDGVYYTMKKCRGRRRSLNALIKIIDNYDGKKLRIGMVHSACRDEAEKLIEKIEKKYSNAKVEMLVTISPALAVHAGKGLIGFIYQEVNEEIL